MNRDLICMLLQLAVCWRIWWMLKSVSLWEEYSIWLCDLVRFLSSWGLSASIICLPYSRRRQNIRLPSMNS
ncbi:Uncharacterised protein [Segatella copri]|nr:Uncharacterised protein [Segatella copri]